MRRPATALLAVLAGLVMVATPAAADTFNFNCITNNNPTDCAIGAAQLTVTVTAVGTTQAQFVFSNSGSSAAVIAEVYFGYFGTNPNLISSIVAPGGVVYSSGGVTFNLGASPPALPGGSSLSPPFVTIATLTTQAKNPAPKNGVGPGESLTVVVNLNNGVTFMDLINAMNLGNSAVGIHVVGYASGGSESFLSGCNGPCTPIPEPGTLALFGSGLLGLAGVIRRKLAS